MSCGTSRMVLYHLQMSLQEDGGGGLLQAQIRAVSATGVASFIHVTSQDGAAAAKSSGGGSAPEVADDEQCLEI